MARNDNARPRLGERAVALAEEISGPDTTIQSSHLEDGIASLQTRIAELETELASARDAAGKASQSSAFRKLLERETDQLHHELATKLDDHHKQMVALLTGIRQMLNIFGEELGGADVEELIKDTNTWLDKVVRPMADDTREPDKKSPEPGRVENENDQGRTDETVASQQMQPGPETREDQSEMALEGPKPAPEVDNERAI